MPDRIPRNYAGAAAFGVAHLPVFNEEPVSRMLTAAQVAAFTANTAAFVADLAARDAAKDAYEAAVLKVQTSRRTYLKQANTCLKAIDVFAADQPSPELAAKAYEDARVAPPAAGSPTPPPARPTNATATLDNTGAVSVDWKGSRAGASFRVQRMLRHADSTDTGWVLLPQTVGRPFTDFTLPAGTVEAQYQVQSWRGAKSSPWSEPAALRFTAAAGANAQLKLAA